MSKSLRQYCAFLYTEKACLNPVFIDGYSPKQVAKFIIKTNPFLKGHKKISITVKLMYPKKSRTTCYAYRSPDD